MTKRLLPSFLIIGERKCGTSSLYRYLLEHPAVLPGTRKEMQFFTKGREHVRKHWNDYLGEFPKADDSGPATLTWPELDEQGILYEERLGFDRCPGVRYVSGEASADTFCDADPELVREFLPQARLILLLRDPVERAFSHHRMYQRFRDEGRDLGFAVGDFSDDMRAEMQRTEQGAQTPCVGPSLYLDNLKRWKKVWGDALLVRFSSELDAPLEFPKTMSQVLEHLGLSEHSYALATRYNQAPAVEMPRAIRQELRAFFAPHDAALADYLRTPLPWASRPRT